MSVQLARTGQTDVHMTGDPKVTLFSSVYTRHTPFLKQYVEVPFNNKVSGITTSFTAISDIPFSGDFITDISLKATGPSIMTSSFTEARLMIGNHKISTVTGTYLITKVDTMVPTENQPGFKVLNASPGLITLDFGFKNLPICCLQLNEITVEIDFVASSGITAASLLVEYGYVGERELKWFQTTKQSIVYRSLKYNTYSLVKGTNTLNITGTIPGPVQRLYMVASQANITNISILFCGQVLIDYSSDYYNLIEIYENAAITPTTQVYMYTFKDAINFSRIPQILMNVTTTQSLTLTLFAETLNVFVADNGLGCFVFL
jgi:hypothetical protein